MSDAADARGQRIALFLAVGETEIRDSIRACTIFEFMFTTFRYGIDVSFRHAII
jgi:hypothetical protein